MHNIPPELEESEIRSLCDPFGGVRKIYMLRDNDEHFLGDAVVEQEMNCFIISLFREEFNYEIDMEGLQDLPIYIGTVIKVEVPDKKWPGFPQRVSVVSSMI